MVLIGLARARCLHSEISILALQIIRSSATQKESIMKRLINVALAAAVVALVAVPMSAGDPPPASPRPELDPQEVFQSAIDRLKDLEAKLGALKGVSDVKPRLQLDDNKRLSRSALSKPKPSKWIKAQWNPRRT